MHGTQKPTQSTGRLWTARRRSKTLLTMLSLLAIVAVACGSDTTTATADGASADPEVETTAEPDVEVETIPAPDETIIDFVEAFGRGDADEAWSYHSARCLPLLPQESDIIVAGYAAEVPGATASNFSTELDGVTAAVSYDVYNGSGEYVDSYISQPWIFSDGQWYRDAC